MVSRKLKIAIFHLGFFFSGGGEKLVLEEVKGLRRKGYLVDIYAPVIDRSRCFPDLLKKEKIKNLFIPLPFYFPLRDFLAINASVFLTPLLFWRFKGYDVFLGANQPGPLICFLLSRILKKPYIIYLAQPTRLIYPRKIDRELGFGKGSFDLFYFFAQLFRPVFKKLDEISIKKANLILANGEYIASVLEKTYQIKTISCPAGCYPSKNLLKISRFKGTMFLKKKKIEKPYILLTNRHFPQKRFDYLISSLPFILKKIPEVSLVITGAETSYTQYLKAMICQLGIKDKVLFLGLVSERELKKLYQNSALYVYTAPCEDFGMGVIEAMGEGVPVVAWENGGPAKTIIHGQTGYLAKQNDLADFTKGIVKLLIDQKLNKKMGKQAWKRSFDFSYKNHLKILEESFLKVVATA